MPGMTRIAPALLVGLVAIACTTGPRTPPPPRRPGPLREVLPNGARVVVEQRPGEVAAVQLWVRAGSRDEGPGEEGLAHLLEHMLFRGTAARPGGLIEREVEAAGGRINAVTSLDYTAYHVLLPAARTLAAVDVLADLGANAALDEDALARERRVVLEEMRREEDSAARLLLRALYAVAFDGHPYGRPLIGRADVVREATRQRLLEFYRRHYAPESFALVVVGPARPDEVLAAARRTLGRLPRQEWSRLPAPPPPEVPGPPREEPRPEQQASLALGWLAPRLDHADTPALDLLVTVLGRGRSSRLVQSLRDRLGLVEAVESGHAALERAGLVWVTARLAPAHLGRVEQAVLAEVRRLGEAGVGEDERARALVAAEARREFQAETVEGRAVALGRAETIWRLPEELAYLDRLRSVTRQQLRAVARRYLAPDRAARVVFLPARGPAAD